MKFSKFPDKSIEMALKMLLSPTRTSRRAKEGERRIEEEGGGGSEEGWEEGGGRVERGGESDEGG